MGIKKSEFTKYIKSLEAQELRTELTNLFEKLDQVKAYYVQELSPKEHRAQLLKGLKQEIYDEFWTKRGQPRLFSNAELKRILTDFEIISVFPHELIDLVLYRVEMLTRYANNYGGVPDSGYNTAITAFKKAVKLIRLHKLEEHFDARIRQLFLADNLDMWYIDFLEEIYSEK
jgi:hypothetical protein